MYGFPRCYECVLMGDGGVRGIQTLVNESMVKLDAGHDTVHLGIEGAIWEMVINPERQHPGKKYGSV